METNKDSLLKKLNPLMVDLLKGVSPGGMSKKVRAHALCAEFQELYKDIPGSAFSNEKIYLCLNSLLDIPKAACGNYRRFININEGYSEYCRLPKQAKTGVVDCKYCRKIIDSRKDYSKSGFRSERFKQVLEEKYGVTNISQTEKQKQFLRETCKFNDPGFRKDSLDKMIERFGSEEKLHEYKSEKSKFYRANMTSEQKESHRKATSDGILRSSFVRKIKSFKKIDPLFNSINYIGAQRKNKYDFNCKDCGYTFSVNVYENKEPRCPQCKSKEPAMKSKEENDFSTWVQSILPSSEFSIRGDRTLINPYELDLYLPDKKIAFEYCGVYWHQEKFVGKNKHQEKIRLCNEKGVKLITIFSDDWKYKKEIIKYRIGYLLGVSIKHKESTESHSIFDFESTMNQTIHHEKKKIYARQCSIREINSVESNMHLDKWHLQGGTTASVRLGLFYESELLSVMTFGKCRYNKTVQWELIRFASSTNVPGAQSKLFKYFVTKYNPESILSYADLSYGTGESYSMLGFKFQDWTVPDYSYVYKNKDYRENRQKFQKHIISTAETKHLTESQIMETLGYYKVYGTGSARYIWRK